MRRLLVFITAIGLLLVPTAAIQSAGDGFNRFYVFRHATTTRVARATRDGRVYWVDPTNRTILVGWTRAHEPDFRYYEMITVAEDGEAGAGGIRRLQAAIVEEMLADASGEVRQRMVDFAWASMHGFITLVLEGEIGGRDSSRALKSRGLAVLAAMAETVVRAAR